MTLESSRSRVDRRHEPTLALLNWGHVIEDFLDLNGLTLETFSREFTGSWMFGYVEALRDYWLARADLMHLASGRLPASREPRAGRDAGRVSRREAPDDH